MSETTTIVECPIVLALCFVMLGAGLVAHKVAADNHVALCFVNVCIGDPSALPEAE